MKREAGFTLIEILVVVAIIATLAGLVTVVVQRAQFEKMKLECTHHVQQIVGLIEAEAKRYPSESGPNLILYLVQRGQIGGKDGLEMLFCPGDLHESLADAGGPAAYDDIDLARREYGHLTSYAGRDQSKPELRAKKGAQAVVLVADDSGDHHDHRGIVVGLTGGAVKWRDKFDDYGLGKDDEIVVGPGSPTPELAVLVTE